MPFIKNLTLRPIIVPLNSGTNLRLSPEELSSDIPDVELKDNTIIDKLQRQRTIAVQSQIQADEPAVARREAPEPSTPDRSGVSTGTPRRN
jgi:hypothetical protein